MKSRKNENQPLSIEELTLMLEKCTAPFEVRDIVEQQQGIINRQQAEIENLKIENQALRAAANSYKLHYNKVLANDVIELPCKVGDMVHEISFLHKIVTPLKVEGFICNLSSWKVHCTHLVPSWVGNQKEHIYISFSSFGKTVFLTEEAEKALKRGGTK